MDITIKKLIDIDNMAKGIINNAESKRENIDELVENELNKQKIKIDAQYNAKYKLNESQIKEKLKKNKEEVDTKMDMNLKQLEEKYRENQEKLVEEITQKIIKI